MLSVITYGEVLYGARKSAKEWRYLIDANLSIYCLLSRYRMLLPRHTERFVQTWKEKAG